ncbi:MAG: hypothetical protein F4Z79_02700 [Acidimicrobiia bacterium]|nr:hypothetical protein [Acidimicrobiia bacterium]
MRTVEGLDRHGAMHSGLRPRLFECQHPDAAGVFGLLGRGPGIELSRVRTPYPCSCYDEHNDPHDDYHPCAPDHHIVFDYHPCAHYNHRVVFDNHQHVHYDDHDQIKGRAAVHGGYPCFWVGVSCGSPSASGLSVGGVTDVYLSRGS